METQKSCRNLNSRVQPAIFGSSCHRIPPARLPLHIRPDRHTRRDCHCMFGRTAIPGATAIAYSAGPPYPAQLRLHIMTGLPYPAQLRLHITTGLPYPARLPRSGGFIQIRKYIQTVVVGQDEFGQDVHSQVIELNVIALFFQKLAR
jgi:hypothetical protein